MKRPIHVAILGASGYGAGELLRLFTQHPEVEVVSATSTSQVGQPLAQLHPHLRGFYDLRTTAAVDFEQLLAGEYAVALLLVLSILYSLAYRRREARRYGYSFEISLACFIASGMAFTLYTDVYGFFNMLGHILHGYGAYILLFGFVVKSAQTLMDRHFYDLNEQIRSMNRELENRVAQRTRELEDANALLASDIARRKEAEEHLRTAKEEAEEANRAKSAFLATMSQREASRSKRPSEGTKSARRSTAFSAWRPT